MITHQAPAAATPRPSSTTTSASRFATQSATTATTSRTQQTSDSHASARRPVETGLPSGEVIGMLPAV